MRISNSLALLLALQAPEPVAADIDPAKQVVIVVNENVADSLAIGAYYAKRRKIPESQVCRIKAGGGDRVNGGPGNDRVDAANGRRDRVNCGKGRRDRVRADRKDRLRGCELVRVRRNRAR